MNLIKSIFFFYLLAVSSVVFAADYSWYNNQQGYYVTYSTPSLACDAGIDYLKSSQFPNMTLKKPIYRGSSETTFYCDAYTYGPSVFTTTTITINRRGSSCPVDATYNSVTGECESPEENVCQLLKGERTTYYVKTQLNGDPPSTIDINGCEATFGGVITCGNRADGYGVCTGFATITGEETPQGGGVAGDGVECTGDDCLSEAPEPFSKEIPCVYVTDPDTGAKLCSGSTVFDKPGKVTCGQANGEWQCREDPLSTSVEKKTDSKIEEKNNLDGSTDTTKTDKTTVTTCKGIKNCTTTDKTTVEKGGTAPDGTDKGKDTECIGKACDAPEDVEGDLEDGEDDVPAPTVDKLEKPTEKAGFDDANDEWDQKIETAKEELKSKSQDIVDLFQPLEQINLTSGGAELPCGNSFEVLGKSTSICFSKYSEQLLPLAAIILFICTVIALFIIFKD